MDYATPEVPPIKPGVKTTEFWLTVVNTLVGLAVTLGYLQPDEADTLVKGVVSVVGGLMILIPFALYIISRVTVKNAQAKSGGVVPVLPMSDVNLYPSSNPTTYAQ
jgi:hypothetical protein